MVSDLFVFHLVAVVVAGLFPAVVGYWIYTRREGLPARLFAALLGVSALAVEGLAIQLLAGGTLAVAIFYVEDDGPGIPPSVADRLFETGVTSDTGGTGLGLAIVDAVATAHGWTVAAGEGSDGGARFTVRGVDLVAREALGAVAGDDSAAVGDN